MPRAALTMSELRQIHNLSLCRKCPNEVLVRAESRVIDDRMPLEADVETIISTCKSVSFGVRYAPALV